VAAITGRRSNPSSRRKTPHSRLKNPAIFPKARLPGRDQAFGSLKIYEIWRINGWKWVEMEVIYLSADASTSFPALQ
jgi:hypothetical protein